MWIFTKKGFVSIVADRDDPDLLLVRARLPGHIEALVPDTVVSETPLADYRFRARVSRGEFMDLLSEEIYDIDYDNFKEAAGEKQHPYLMEIWDIMHRQQEWVRDTEERQRGQSDMMTIENSNQRVVIEKSLPPVLIVKYAGRRYMLSIFRKQVTVIELDCTDVAGYQYWRRVWEKFGLQRAGVKLKVLIDFGNQYAKSHDWN